MLPSSGVVAPTCAGGVERDDRLVAVHPQRARVEEELVDRRHAARHVERLPRRQYLKGLCGEEEAHGARRVAAVGDQVAHEQRRRARWTGSDRGDLQREQPVDPRDRWNWQIAVLELLADLRVVPAHQRAVGEEERLDRESAFLDLRASRPRRAAPLPHRRSRRPRSSTSAGARSSADMCRAVLPWRCPR